MSNGDGIEQFLKEFKVMFGIWGVIYRDDRGKNSRTLLELEIRPADRDKILKELKLEDYSEGPILETLNGGSDMWVFGRQLKGKEIYIKIALGGSPGERVICISFHTSEYPMVFPYKR